jgi:hypothetical protein
VCNDFPIIPSAVARVSSEPWYRLGDVTGSNLDHHHAEFAQVVPEMSDDVRVLSDRDDPATMISTATAVLRGRRT